MKRLLIANRGEIARRVMRTAREMGIETVAVFSEADADAPFAREANLAVALGGFAADQSYLDFEKVLDAARRSGADAVHPGYGFLAENADFAQACRDAGLIWVGPAPQAIRAMAGKIEARRLAAEAGVAVLPGVTVGGDDRASWHAAAAEVGLPLLVKASAGGGGRGMRRVSTLAELEDAIESARREAAAAFGDPTVFLERWLVAPRHVEVQVFGDTQGNLVHLFERECSIQRRHQKLIEEAPAPCLSPAIRAALHTAALRVARGIGYTNAGTIEFLVDDGDAFWFLEMNTRLQVEHPVTEAVTGLDLVRLQLRVADGEPLGFTQEDVVCSGHAVEARLYAEDPSRDFLPATGRVERFEVGSATPEMRFDTGVETGSEVSPYYDALLAKAIAHAPSRDEAVKRLARGLRELQVHGVPTNRDCLVAVLESDGFARAEATTDFLGQHLELVGARTPADVERLQALAASLVIRHRRRSEAVVLGFVPGNWRNLPAVRPVAKFSIAGQSMTVEYQVRADRVVNGCVDGHELVGRIHGIDRTWIDLETDGVRARHAVHSTDEAHYVNGLGWQTRFEDVPRYGSPGLDRGSQGPSAPLPGRVVAVNVAVGQHVLAGQTLVVLDAMKIEHLILADIDGTVAEVRVAPGDRVDAHQVLVVLDA